MEYVLVAAVVIGALAFAIIAPSDKHEPDETNSDAFGYGEELEEGS